MQILAALSVQEQCFCPILDTRSRRINCIRHWISVPVSYTHLFSKEDKIIISVGLFIERKGILDFVELAKQMPEYQFIWFGYTNLNTVPRKIRQAVQTKLPNLHFPGYVSREELIDAYCGSDLFFFPTYEETEGIVLLEAFAIKIPVVVRDIPIYKKWVPDKIAAYKGKNNLEFKYMIRGILEGRLPSTVEKGYEIAEERSIDKIGKKLVAVYRVALQRTQP